MFDLAVLTALARRLWLRQTIDVRSGHAAVSLN
jgi:hypothetical protein